MFKKIFKKPLIVFLCVYVGCFCIFFYSNPIKNLSQWDWAKGINNDFGIYQRAARHFINGEDVYNEVKYIYPPSFAMLLSPLLIFPASLQRSIWVVLNIGMVAVLLLILMRYFTSGGKKYQEFGIAVIVTVSSIPLLHNFKWGQVSLLISLLVIISYISYKRNNHILSALTLAIASSIKILPAIFLLFYMVNLKKGLSKLLLWFIVFSSLVFFLLPVLSLGYSGTRYSYKRYYDKMTAQDKWRSYAVWNNQTITGILFRYFSKDYASIKVRKSFPPFPQRPPGFLPFKTVFTSRTVHTIGKTLSLLTLIITLYLSRIKYCRPDVVRGDVQEDMRFCLFVSGCFIYTNHAWVHYYVLLILPYYLLFILLMKNCFNPSLVIGGLFIISFACMHGNIFLLRSTNLFEMFEYLGVFYWANILLYISLLFYLNHQKTEGQMQGVGQRSKSPNSGGRRRKSRIQKSEVRMCTPEF